MLTLPEANSVAPSRVTKIVVSIMTYTYTIQTSVPSITTLFICNRASSIVAHSVCKILGCSTASAVNYSMLIITHRLRK